MIIYICTSEIFITALNTGFRYTITFDICVGSQRILNGYCVVENCVKCGHLIFLMYNIHLVEVTLTSPSLSPSVSFNLGKYFAEDNSNMILKMTRENICILSKDILKQINIQRDILSIMVRVYQVPLPFYAVK